MNNSISMSVEFEKQKNTRASIYTAVITGSILLLFLWMKLSFPQDEKPPVEEYIEINLGTGDMGMGTDQPELPGEPAPAQQTAYVPPQPVQSSEESVRDVETDDNNNDAPAIIKPVNPKPDATRINQESRTTRNTNTTPQPVVTQPVRQPKAVAGRTLGGNGSGGNGADSYRPGGNEGIAGGTGDQGRVGGSPNGRNYSGSPRNLGMRVISMPSQSFEDDFNENGNIVLDVSVDEKGKLISATYQISGSTLSRSSKQYDIALRRAREVNWPKYEGGFKQRVSFKFTVK